MLQHEPGPCEPNERKLATRNHSFEEPGAAQDDTDDATYSVYEIAEGIEVVVRDGDRDLGSIVDATVAALKAIAGARVVATAKPHEFAWTINTLRKAANAIENGDLDRGFRLACSVTKNSPRAPGGHPHASRINMIRHAADLLENGFDGDADKGVTECTGWLAMAIEALGEKAAA